MLRLATSQIVAVDLVIDIENTPGALARVAAAISDAGVNIAAATCIGPGERAELHILVPHAEAAKHSLAISHLAVSREREVVVVDVEDRPGVLADLTRKIARAGVDLDLVYVATRNRVVFGAADLMPSRPRWVPRADGRSAPPARQNFWPVGRTRISSSVMRRGRLTAKAMTSAMSSAVIASLVVHLLGACLVSA